jgi:predicted double-glycine peptidase
MDYSETELGDLNAKLVDVERRRAWMSDIAVALKARNCAANVAEGQNAILAALAQDMGVVCSRMEDSIIAKREIDAAD